MRLNQPLLKLPIQFRADVLAAEVTALPRSAWEPHPQGFPGNEAVPLVSPGGRLTSDFVGPMAPTEYLKLCPYMMEAMAQLRAVWGRGRLMGLGPGAEVPPHVDTNYYWRTHVRVHVPVITNDRVDFTCGGQTVQMAAGDCWVFDTFQEHRVENKGAEQRVHLVLDTVGGEQLWDLIDAAQAEAGREGPLLQPGMGSGEPLQFEQQNFPDLMTPWELRAHIDELLGLALPEAPLDAVRRRLDRFAAGWTAAWARFGTEDDGLPTYRSLLHSLRIDLQALGGERIMLSNGRPLYKVLHYFVFDNAIGADRVRRRKAAPIKDAGSNRPAVGAPLRAP